MARLSTANDIINRAAGEFGLVPVVDPVASTDESFRQLVVLLDEAGQELVELHPWQILVKEYQVLTGTTPPVAGTTGTFDLPDDFSYMIDQTGWEHSSRVAVGGPLSAQDWTYLKGRDLISQSIYASFRLVDNKFDIFPQDPVPDGLDINFEYITTEWVITGQVTPTYQSEVITGTDKPLFDKTLITRYVKLKWLEAGGFDTSKAQADFNMLFNFTTGHNAGAPVLNAGRGRGGLPYISNYNVPDTGFGL